MIRTSSFALFPLVAVLACSGSEPSSPGVGAQGGAEPLSTAPVAFGGAVGTAPSGTGGTGDTGDTGPSGIGGTGAPGPSGPGGPAPSGTGGTALSASDGGGPTTGGAAQGSGGASVASGGASALGGADPAGGAAPAMGGAPVNPPPMATGPGVCRGFNNGSGTTVPCATTSDGKAVCFEGAEPVPLTYAGGAEVTDVKQVTGQNFYMAACAIVGSGAVHCGGNSNINMTPVIASGATMVSGSQDGACAIVAGGVSCWKDPSAGAVTAVTLGAEIPKQIACYYKGCCVATESGKMLCWGDTTAIGAPTTPSTSPISPAMTPAKLLQLGPGQDHICGVFEGGKVQCWGKDWNKQLGGLGESSGAGVTLVEGGATAVACGQFHTCVLMADGQVQCASASQTEGAGLDTGVLTAVEGVKNAVALSAGKHYTCARLADGAVQCWGKISGGAAPVTITGLVTAACE